MSTTSQIEQSLKARWSVFKEENPKTRIRDAAKQLGVTEADLVATGIGKTCTRLRPAFADILRELHTLGNVMALTRNDAAVHEATNVFSDEMSLHGQTALFFRPGQDTRYFLEQWHFAFAVNENDRLSLQFFDQQGIAAHKIYMVKESNIDAYHALVEKYQMPEQLMDLGIDHDSLEQGVDKTVAIDAEKLRERWANIQNVHEGNRIIKAHNNQRIDIYKALGEEYARQLSTDSVEKLLNLLSESGHGCMIFVMNHASVQSYSGQISRLLRTGPWFNVLDPDFNLHLQTGLIGAVWLITKPSEDGVVNSLSIFDQHETEIMVMTDNRSRGDAESEQWREMLAQLEAAN